MTIQSSVFLYVYSGTEKDHFSLFLNLTFGKVSLFIFALEKTELYKSSALYKYSLNKYILLISHSIRDRNVKT